MSYEHLNGKVLFFKMVTRRAKTDSLFRIEGFAKLTVTGSAVTMVWPAHPGATEFKSVTFDRKVVERFVANTKGESFAIVGETCRPDFIYIEGNPK
jgi:hypothetical protein